MFKNTCFEVAQKFKAYRRSRDAQNFHTMDLGDMRIDDLDNRANVAAWVREMKPACIIGSSKGKSGDHISWCCSLYKLQVGEGMTYVHEHGLGSQISACEKWGRAQFLVLVR